MQLLKEEDYLKNIEIAKGLLVDLSTEGLTPNDITDTLVKCSNNLNKLTKMLSEAVINLQAYDQVMKTTKAEFEIKKSAALLTEEVSFMKTAELRDAKASEIVKDLKVTALTALEDRDAANMYVTILRTYYDTLSITIGLIKEKIKLLQGLTYLESNVKE
jgi:hypothetical protein